MARGDIYEAAEATGIPLKKLKSKKSLCASDQEKYNDFLAQVAFELTTEQNLLRCLSGEPNPAFVAISNDLDLPFIVVRNVARLRRVVSKIHFSETEAPLARDNSTWTEVNNPKRKGAQINKLSKALANVEKALDGIFLQMEGKSSAAQLLLDKTPENADMHLWVEAVQEFREVAVAACEYKRDTRGNPNLPDWVHVAASYLKSSDICEEKFHALVLALEPTWSIADGQDAWRDAEDDKTIDWSDPLVELEKWQVKIN